MLFYSKSNRILTGLIFLLLYCLSVYVPWGYRPYINPSNNGWVLTLHYAFTHGWQSGKDIIFTFGPLGFLYYGITPITECYTILAWLFMGVVLFLSVNELLGRSIIKSKIKSLIITVLAVGVVVIPDVVDAQAYLLIFTYILFEITEVNKEWIRNLLAVSLAILSLVKFSWAIAAFGVISTVEISACVKREWRFAMAFFLGTFIALWAWSKQEIFNLFGYFSNSWEVASKYGMAMSVSTPNTGIKILVYTITCATLLFLYIKYFLGKSHRKSNAFLLLAIAFYLFIIFKAGYVRNDYHEVVSICTLISSILLSFLFLEISRRKKLILLAMPGIMLLVVLYGYNSNIYFDQRIKKALGGGFYDAYSYLFTGWNKNQYLVEEYKSSNHLKAYKEIIHNNSVDVLPFGECHSLILGGFNYKPRPIFESYCAYSKKLGEFNEASLYKGSCPEYVLLKIQSIDGRFPTLDDSLYLLGLLSNFKINNSENDYLVMKKTEACNPPQLLELSTFSISREHKITVPESKNPVCCTVVIPYNYFGSIMNIIYKTTPPHISVELDGGETRFYSLPSDESANTFLLSPLIQDSKAFLQMVNSAARTIPKHKVLTVKFDGDASYNWNASKITFYELK